ncbi:serine hydrolase domain-containing protein [Candidatus Foliamicus sp.]
MKKLLRALGLALAWTAGSIVGLLTLAALGFLVAKPTETARFFGLFADKRPGHMQWVEGAPEQPLPTAGLEERSLTADSLEAALAYGAASGSDALLVWRGGRLQLEHYYEGASPSTITSTQSMHKSVVALLLGIAIAEGHIASVDDPVSRYLPEWRDGDRAEITLRHLLWQSSGIDFPSFTFSSLVPIMGLLIGQDMRPVTLRQQAMEPPLTTFEYNSINPLVLGLVIENATATPYTEYFAKALWTPLKAGSAWVQMDRAGGMARSYCCLDVTARGWLRLGLLHLNKGMANGVRIVPEEWIAQIQTPAPTNPNHGYLTWLGNEYVEMRRYNSKSSLRVYHSEPFVADDLVFFDGFGGQRVYIVPSADMVIVRTGAIATDWDDARLPNVLLAGLL